MGPLKALIGAAVGGAIGAGIWAAVAYNMDREIGWIAWGVGLLCGLGAALAARGDADNASGAIAALVALLSVCAGKYLAVHYVVQDMVKGVGAITITETDARLYMAGQLVTEYTNEGTALKWPEGKSEDDAENLEDYPADIRKDVHARWDAMSPTEREGYIGAIRAQGQHIISLASGEAETEGFFAMFDVLDILFFFLAIGTAYKVGSGDIGGDGD